MYADIFSHVRAEDLDLTQSDGDDVQYVYSFGNPGWNFYRQGTNQKRPEYKDSGGLNDFSYLDFDGVDHSLPVFTGTSQWDSDSFWAMGVVVGGVSTTTTDPIAGNTDLSQDSWLSMWGTSGSNHRIANNANYYDQSADKLSSDQIRIIQGKTSSGTGSVSEIVNGTAIYANQSITTTTGKYTFNTIAQMGRTYRGTVSYRNTEMELHEFIMMEGSIESVDRQILEGYWAHKYDLAGSLPATHPYKTTAPTEPTYELSSDIVLTSSYSASQSVSISIDTGDEITLFVPKQQNAGVVTAEFTVS